MKEHCDYGVVVQDRGLVGYDDLNEALEIYQKI